MGVIRGFFADSDLSSKTLNKKVREGQLAQWNYIAVVGEKEMQDFLVNVRSRDSEKTSELGVQAFVDKLEVESMPSSKSMNVFEEFEGRKPSASTASASPAADAPSQREAPSGGNKAQPAGKGQPASGKAAAAPKIQRANSLKDRKQAGLDLDDDVESFLENHPYVKGFRPTRADYDLFNQLCESNFLETPGLRRWFEHMESFAAAERASWPEN